MNVDPVVVLPIFAAAIALWFPLRIRSAYHSGALRISHVRLVWFRRLSIFVLVLSALVASMIPVPGISSLAVGALLSGVVLAPAYLVHKYLHLTSRRRRGVFSKRA